LFRADPQDCGDSDEISASEQAGNLILPLAQPGGEGLYLAALQKETAFCFIFLELGQVCGNDSVVNGHRAHVLSVNAFQNAGQYQRGFLLVFSINQREADFSRGKCTSAFQGTPSSTSAVTLRFSSERRATLPDWESDLCCRVILTDEFRLAPYLGGMWLSKRDLSTSRRLAIPIGDGVSMIVVSLKARSLIERRPVGL
jgi:hypothetical protein